MKKIQNNSWLLLLAWTVLTISMLSSCHKDLDIKNENNPVYADIFDEPDDAYNIGSIGFFRWWQVQTTSVSPRMAMWTAADQGTCSWANSGMWHLSDEPRRPFNNDVSYTYASITSNYYSKMYGILKDMNEIQKKIKGGMDFGSKKKNKLMDAYTQFIQGISLGYLGLVFDQAVIITENTTDPLALRPQPYDVVLDTAIARLENVVNICEHSHFKLPDTWINGDQYDEDELAELARSFIVRFTVFRARNKAQNDQTDWQKVLDLSKKGIQKPLAPYIDNNQWFCYYKHYTTSRSGWARIDCRIINLMDPGYPSRFPDDGINPPAASSNDARLNAYFNFASSNNMKPERGYVHYSNYEFSRYPYTTNPGDAGNVVDFPVVENDLYRAEANARLGHLPEAISIINAGTRVTAGQLAPLPDDASQEDILDAIFYERDIELIQTGFGTAFFDMRRRDYLQKGTPLHFPVPGRELQVLQMPNYSFGGVGNADGINTSNGGW